ncbi:MAG: hypothetical protein PHP92_04150 [Candidatus Nanoarchaeia archaeon]|nr:hypothetical protein [Candidatus Nanoarchaeia archaeon]
MKLSLNDFCKKYQFNPITIKNQVKKNKFPLDSYEIKNLLHQKKIIFDDIKVLNYMFSHKNNFKKLRRQITRQEVKHGTEIK